MLTLANSLDRQVENVALGQGQAPLAIRIINSGLREGRWAFLANCHLMLSWLPELEKIIEAYCAAQAGSIDPPEPHADFRLWLSASPSKEFPITILQRGIKMTTEPPRGLRANMLTLYNLVTEEQFARCGQQFKYKKLLFALCWFHAILLERRKFKALGFNVPYDFNESDWAICHDLIIVFLDEYPDKTPFEAMRYLIAEANYGGRVTEFLDRRLVNVYIAQFIAEDAIALDQYPLSELPDYFVPSDGDLNSYKESCKAFPQSDHAAAFGQHPNADISSQITDTQGLLATIISLQPKVVVEGEESNESKLLKQCEAMLETVPAPWNVRETKMTMDARSDPDPLKTVLFQEIDRYNSLLGTVKSQLKQLVLAVQGLVSITPLLEEVMGSLLDFKVPKVWGKTYPSIKALAPWMRDLSERYDAFEAWIGDALPKVFWLPSFTYPTGFLTALLQTSARKNGIAIDTLSWEFPIVNQDASSITQYAKDGAYIKGLFLEGARWDSDNGYLTEPIPMELMATMPVIHFKPVENKKKVTKGIYSCPLYMYPIRTGSRERPSYVSSVDLKAGRAAPEVWVKRGTALLLATAF